MTSESMAVARDPVAVRAVSATRLDAAHEAAAIARHAVYDPYESLINGKIADLNIILAGPFAGSFTAALLLRRFVERAERWAHLDVYGWNPVTRPGRSEGGEVQAADGVYSLLKARIAR